MGSAGAAGGDDAVQGQLHGLDGLRGLLGPGLRCGLRGLLGLRLRCGLGLGLGGAAAEGLAHRQGGLGGLRERRVGVPVRPGGVLGQLGDRRAVQVEGTVGAALAAEPAAAVAGPDVRVRGEGNVAPTLIGGQPLGDAAGRTSAVVHLELDEALQVAVDPRDAACEVVFLSVELDHVGDTGELGGERADESVRVDVDLVEVGEVHEFHRRRALQAAVGEVEVGDALGDWMCVDASLWDSPLANAFLRHSSFVAPVWKEMKSQPSPDSSQIVPSVSAVQNAGKSRVPAYWAATALRYVSL